MVSFSIEKHINWYNILVDNSLTECYDMLGDNDDREKKSTGVSLPPLGRTAGYGFIYGSGRNPVNEYLKPFHAKDQEKMVTSTMINNYVKHGIVSPPVKKKYTKNHVAYLMVVCILKMVYRMDEISKLIRVQIYKYPIDQAYNYFCAELECCLKCIFAHKKVHHAPSDDEGSLVVDLIRNTVQAVAYTIYVRHELEHPQIMIQEESDT